MVFLWRLFVVSDCVVFVLVCGVFVWCLCGVCLVLMRCLCGVCVGLCGVCVALVWC